MKIHDNILPITYNLFSLKTSKTPDYKPVPKENMISLITAFFIKKINEEINIYISTIKKNETKQTPTDFNTILKPVKQIISLYLNFIEKKNSINLNKLFNITRSSNLNTTNQFIKKIENNKFQELLSSVSEENIFKIFDIIYTQTFEENKTQNNIKEDNIKLLRNIDTLTK